jgi:ribosomal-protein-alanine N-acetyltransferase
MKLLRKDTTRPDSDGVLIRFVIRKDMPDVMRIENGSFEHQLSEKEILGLLAQRNTLGVVAERNGKVVAMMIYELHPKLLNIYRIAVLPEHRRCGIASKLVSRLTSTLETQRRDAVCLDISEVNLPGQLFFAANGFRATAVINDRWEGFSEAAYVMCYKPTPKEDGPLEPGNRLTPYFE